MLRAGLSIVICLLVPQLLHAQVDTAPPRTKQVVAPTPAHHEVTVVYTDNAFDVPAAIPAGVTTFAAVNHGKELHHGTLVRVDSGKTVADLVAALKARGPLPGWATMVGGPQTAGTVTIALPAGRYVWVCLIPGLDGIPHFAKGMVREMRVGPDHIAAAAPAPDITVTGADYNWKVSKPITAGRHVIRVATAANSQPHELMIVRLPPGKTVQDLVAWGNHPTGMPPAESIQGLAPLEAKLVGYATVDFKPGRYAFICFIPDAKDGLPHASHGMVQEFTIP